MALHIVIDGYNFIRCSKRLSAVEQTDLQAAREQLADDLAAYKRIKPHKITIVFDGTNAPSALPQRSRLKGIELRYSRSGELADAVIKRMAARERERLLVVSSDREITEYAVGRGSAVIDSEAFEDRLDMARVMQMKGAESDSGSGWYPSTRKKGPARRLPKKNRKMRRRIAKL